MLRKISFYAFGVLIFMLIPTLKAALLLLVVGTREQWIKHAKGTRTALKEVSDLRRLEIREKARSRPDRRRHIGGLAGLIKRALAQ